MDEPNNKFKYNYNVIRITTNYVLFSFYFLGGLGVLLCGGLCFGVTGGLFLDGLGLGGVLGLEGLVGVVGLLGLVGCFPIVFCF